MQAWNPYLEAWSTDDRTWPKNRTFEIFQESFEFRMRSIVQDLNLDEPLEYIDSPGRHPA